VILFPYYFRLDPFIEVTRKGSGRMLAEEAVFLRPFHQVLLGDSRHKGEGEKVGKVVTWRVYLLS
jgi:hypothetical protein